MGAEVGVPQPLPRNERHLIVDGHGLEAAAVTLLAGPAHRRGGLLVLVVGRCERVTSAAAAAAAAAATATLPATRAELQLVLGGDVLLRERLLWPYGRFDFGHLGLSLGLGLVGRDVYY